MNPLDEMLVQLQIGEKFGLHTHIFTGTTKIPKDLLIIVWLKDFYRNTNPIDSVYNELCAHMS